MIYTLHSHCFSKCQLEFIIDSYLSLAPYYQILLKTLRTNTQQYQQQPDPHRTEKPHPIRVYTRDYQCSKNVLDEEEESASEARTDIKLTYASSNIRYFYLFPLEYVIEILESSQFYSLLPQNIIINGLLTATNLQIIIETLTIVSEDMSKKIRLTIAGKELTSTPEKDEIIEEDARPTSIKNNFSFQQIPVSSIVQIAVEDEEEAEEEAQMEVESKLTLLQKSSKLIKKEIAGTKRYISIDREVGESQCRFCQGYLIYLYQTVGENPLDDDINRLSQESIRCLGLISKIIPHFTLYLSETNQTHVPNDLHTINRILNSLGLIITQDIFSSQLNPKTLKPTPISQRKPKNLIEQLQPYFNTIQKKKGSISHFSIQQLFRMIIYCPTTEEVCHQLVQQQAEQFQKEIITKNYNKTQKVKTLLKKQCEDMKQFEEERLTIAQHTVNTRPIYKQLQLQEENISINSKPNHYNAYNSTKSNIKQVFNDRSLTASNGHYNHPLKSDNKTLMIQLSNTLFRQEKLEDKKLKKKSSKNQKLPLSKKDKNNHEIFNIDFGSLTMSTNLKKNTLKPHQFTHSKPQNLLKPPQLELITQNLLTISTELADNISIKPPPETVEDQNQLSDVQFTKILLNCYSKKYSQGKCQNTSNLSAAFSSSPQPNMMTSALLGKAKKNNNTYSSLSHFIGRKQQQQQMDCIQKKQKQIFNKQMLNGTLIKNEVYEEIKRGIAQVYQDFASTISLSDTFKLERKIPAPESSQKTIASPQSFCSKKRIQNIISSNSTKFNDTGLIRNSKYNKCIKNELINHRHSFLLANQKQNNSKCRLLAQTQTNNKSKSQNKRINVKERYQMELQNALEQRKRSEQEEDDEQSSAISEILL